MSKRVKIEVQENGIVNLKMNDTENKNVFAEDFIKELIEGIDEVENKHKPKVMILSGLKDVFSAGAEKQNLLDLCDGKVFVKDLIISERLVNAPFPVIAAMEGHAVGGGLIMAACCDIVVAAKESRYGAVFMNLGFTPGMGSTKLLAPLVGDFIANEMMFTGKLFKGSQLEKKGTNINYIVPRDEVMTKAEEIALQISEKNIKSIYLLKYALSEKKKKLLIEARTVEDFMHRISFSFPETKKMIKELYGR